MTRERATGRTDRVLIVEDDVHAGLLISRHVRAEGLSAVVAATATEARAMFESQVFDLAVVDLVLGEDSGLDLIRFFRTAATGPLPILVLTACADGRKEAESLDCGADDFLRKPIDGQALRARLRVLLRHGELERRLRASRRFYRSVFDSIGNSVWITDADGRVLARNTAADDLGPGAGAGSRLEDWLGSDAVAQLHSAEGRTRPGGGSEETSVETPHSQHLSLSTSGFVDGDGRLCRVVVGRDRTEAVKLRGALARTTGFLENVVHSSADAIVATDEKGTVVFFSSAAEEIFGYSAAEVIGSPVARYYTDGAATASAVMARLRQESMVRNFSVGFRHSNGRVLDMSLSASLLRDGDGEMLGTLGILKDVSGVSRETRDRIRQEILEAEGRVSAKFGHQVRNFLGIILGRTQLAKRHLEQGRPSTATEDLDVVCNEIGRMGTFAEELMGRSVPSLDGASLDVVRLARVLAESLEGSGRFTGRSINVIAPGSEIRVAMRGRDLEAALVNLLENAADASPLGESIELVCAKGEGGVVSIEVQDRGSGISREVGERVLEERFTTKQDGHGLGLAIVKGLVESAGGVVEFRARAGGGTVFALQIPAVCPSERAQVRA